MATEEKCSFCPHRMDIKVAFAGDPVPYNYCACCWRRHQRVREKKMVLKLKQLQARKQQTQ